MDKMKMKSLLINTNTYRTTTKNVSSSTNGLSSLKNPDSVQQILSYLNLKDQLGLLKVARVFALMIKKCSFFEKYLLIRKEIKISSPNEAISPINNSKLLKKNSVKKKVSINTRTPTSTTGMGSFIRRLTEPITSIKEEKQQPKSTHELKKYSIWDYLYNDGALIKKFVKNLKINHNDSLLIFSGIILSQLKEYIDEEENKTPIQIMVKECKINSAMPYLSTALISYNSNYSKLDLSYNDIEAKYMNLLSTSLKFNAANLIVLNLSNNKLNDLGCKFLTKFLSSPVIKLVFLNLMSNEIGSVGVECLVDFIIKTTSLSTLILQNNLIGAKGMKFISEAMVKNKSVRALNISYNGITSEGMKFIVEMLSVNKKLQSLYIGGNYIQPLGAKYLVEGLKNNKMLSYLFTDWNHIGEEGAEYISELLAVNKNINSIDLQRNNLSDEAVEKIFSVIKMKPQLLSIDLSYNNITHVGVKTIVDVLKTDSIFGNINLEGNTLVEVTKNKSGAEKVNDIAATYISSLLKVNNTLQSINLSYTDLGPSVKFILDSLKENKKLKLLFLSGNKIGSSKDNYLSCLKDMLASNSELIELHLDDNQMTDSDLVHLLEGTKLNTKLKTISIANNLVTNESVDDIYNTIKACKNIFSFNAEGNLISKESLNKINNALNLNKNIKKLEEHFKSKLLMSIANIDKFK